MPLALVWWVLILAALAVYGLRALLRPRELMAPPLLLAFAFAGLYLATYLALGAEARAAFLAPEAYHLLLLLATLCLYAFAAGFEYGRRRPAPILVEPSERLARRYALALCAVGFGGLLVFLERSGGFLAFFSAPHGTAGAWAGSSAYLYSLPAFLFPALFLLLGLRLTGARLTWPALAALLATALYLAFQTVARGNRGDLIRLALIGGFGLLALRPSGRLRPALPLGLGLALAGVLLFPHLRDALHLGAEQGPLEAAALALFPKPAVGLGRPSGTGNELAFAAALVQGARERGSYDLGLQWLYPFLNLVPRLLWPDKPYRHEWSTDPRQLVRDSAGWVVPLGAAPTGVADSFLRFAFAAPLPWLLLGLWGGRLFRRAQERPGVLAGGLLIGYLIALAYAATQSFIAAFHAWLFFALPIHGLGLLARLEASHPARAPTAAAPLARRTEHP